MLAVGVGLAAFAVSVLLGIGTYFLGVERGHKDQIHEHAWKEVRRVFNPPTSFRVKGATGKSGLRMVEEAIHGFTLIELECEICHNISFTRTKGDATVE